jgi:hypothetical protein
VNATVHGCSASTVMRAEYVNRNMSAMDCEKGVNFENRNGIQLTLAFRGQ